MKIVLAVYGTRGDIEPSLAVGCELVRRGHDVRVAVPPDLVGFAEAAGFTAVAYGLDSQIVLEKDLGANLSGETTYRIWQVRNLRRLWRENSGGWRPMPVGTQQGADVLAEGADLLFTGQVFEDGAANVAEYYDIPLATLHYIPLRPNGHPCCSYRPR